MANRSLSRNKIVVLADDLTGANDTGVQFAKQGLKSLVLISLPDSPSDLDEDVLIVDTQSRALTPAEAYEKVAQAVGLFKERGPFRALYKKIDSTLRGNLGSEIDALMDVCGFETAVVAPAFPKNGRITVGGRHLLGGAPLEATEIARDPVCPVGESHIPTLLAGQTRRRVGHVGIKSVLAGSDGILGAMRGLRAEGCEVVVCDAWQDDHLAMIAMAAARLEQSVLWVGSAGLAESLPLALGLGAATAERRPVVVIAGSVSSVTRGQVALLRQRPDVAAIETDPCSFLRPASARDEMDRCFQAAVNALQSGRDVVIVSAQSEDAVARTIEEGRSSGLSPRQSAEAVADALGSLCRRLALHAGLGGLVLTGGDIAVSCCRSLSASGISVIQEVAPGIPLGVLKGGQCPGLGVVTKAGAFGGQDALCKAVDFLKLFRVSPGAESAA
ncbi:MAG: four-carbon acid sugar kinase family protein [Syntrophaceae bacterium]|nr:four-carbon acid sugar kinase family protein [Syntrophaceae bacterium]